jgi:hypothetical protein
MWAEVMKFKFYQDMAPSVGADTVHILCTTSNPHL